jgi:Lon-like ATP-dependent protease
LLSSLSGYPIKQSLAVTGSVNQKGEVQPIGAVNEKIEGFFAVCSARGLTGEQGVLIPAANLHELMLNEKVVAAVEAGQFHLWPVAAVDEGLEILTGVPAGVRKDSRFTDGTVHAAVQKRLRELMKGHDRERDEEKAHHPPAKKPAKKKRPAKKRPARKKNR